MCQKHAQQAGPIKIGDNWIAAARHLSAEQLKVTIYDDTLVGHLGDVRGKHILDYGGGPAVIASRLQALGADVHLFDISKEMCELARAKLNPNRIHERIASVPTAYFDSILCNLVVCIVSEEEVGRILRNIRNLLAPNGVAYVGFCNPRIFDVPESLFDKRIQTGEPYGKPHDYTKVKVEGGYNIIERHRPDEWYLEQFTCAGLRLLTTILTPGYEKDGRLINDFVIFRAIKD